MNKHLRSVYASALLVVIMIVGCERPATVIPTTELQATEAQPTNTLRTVGEADQNAATPSARRMVEITQSPTRLATAIKIPDPSVKITPALTTPGAGYKLNSGSPDLAVEVAHQSDSFSIVILSNTREKFGRSSIHTGISNGD